ncbi:MAG TPA: HAD family hydrolase [bacterium]|jgi:D-glycero-D-manno-heptose 1,7-bisphosphate phosphatase|nr:HAD family hydrolase [bacterium]
MSRPAVFLDRDGTLSEEIGYIHPADLPRYALLPRTAEGLKRLAAAGYALVVLTNQSGVARGYFPRAQVDAVHARLRALLAAEGVALDAVYYCPHHPEPAGPADNGHLPEGRVAAAAVPELSVDCDCRKPKPGLALQAARELGLDLGRSWMVGDKGADLGLADSAGLRGGVLVLTGYGQGTLDKLLAKGTAPRWVAKDLVSAADLILAEA